MNFQFIKIDEYGNIVYVLRKDNRNNIGKFIEISDFEKDIDINSCYYMNGKIVEYSDEILLEKSKPMSPGFKWIPLQGWVDKRTDNMKFDENNQLRIQKLQNSNWTQLPDEDLPNKEEWRLYRKTLREMSRDQIINGIFPKSPEE